MAKKQDSKHKPVIETLINMAAIALATYAVGQLVQPCTVAEFIRYLVLLGIAFGLEFFKYMGRLKNLW
jgi:uncharacterized membrane protein